VGSRATPLDHNPEQLAPNLAFYHFSGSSYTKTRAGGRGRQPLRYAAPGEACAGRGRASACLVPKHPNPGLRYSTAVPTKMSLFSNLLLMAFLAENDAKWAPQADPQILKKSLKNHQQSSPKCLPGCYFTLILKKT